MCILLLNNLNNDPDLTDEELIKLCIRNDTKAQNLLYQRFAAQMGRLCLRYMSNGEEACDILSEGFLKVFRNVKSFEYRGKESLEVWIRKIMINECLMHLRKRRFTFLNIAENDRESEISIESDYSAEEIFRTITTLPDGYRTVFNLFVIEGYSHREISLMLGITESSSRSQLTHARQRLQQLLKNKGWT